MYWFMIANDSVDVTSINENFDKIINNLKLFPPGLPFLHITIIWRPLCYVFLSGELLNSYIPIDIAHNIMWS